VTDPIVLDAVPDLTLAECCARWGVSSRNSIKARAAALGVELRQESSTRTVWPAEHLKLGDSLDAHLKARGTLKDYQGPSLTPVTDSSDAVPMPTAKPVRRSSVTPATDSSDAILALLQALPPPPAPDPLSVARGLAEAAELGAWLNSRELAALLQLSPGTVRGWTDGACPRPGFRLQRRSDHGLWWRVIADSSD
jgi:hypothetical protein